MVIGVTWARGTGSTLQGKNKYPILGKPLISYPLTSLKNSGTVDYHYVFTEDDEIAQATIDAGWRVIPRSERFNSYSGKGFSWEGAWKEITLHIVQDLGMDVPKDPTGWLAAFMILSDVMFNLNCNNCMLRSSTFTRMLAKLHEVKVQKVVPAIKMNDNLFMEMEDGKLFPLWYMNSTNRQECPPLLKTLNGTAFGCYGYNVDGGTNLAHVEIDEFEGLDVHTKADVELIEAYLTTNPDHFDR